MTTIIEAGRQSELLRTLRRLDGRGTVGDVVADSGLPADAVRDGLKSLLESHHGHLAVTDSGEMVYSFDRGMIARGTEPFLSRAWAATRRVVQGGFKAWIVVMLVVYFVIFVVLAIAALFANQRGNDSRGGWGGGRRRGGGFHFNPVFWYWIWGPRWRIGRPYYGHRWERTLKKDDRVPFYKKVFAFVFGPDRPKPTQRQLDRGKLRLIRARAGVVTTAELVEHTGTSVPDGEDEMGRLLGTYDGEPVVSPDGELVYAFPALMASTGRSDEPRPPLPTWRRLEPKLELTGNTPGANAAVVGMNAFTLVASATAPWFIFPRLGIGGVAAFWALVIVPVVFSVLFFTGPLVRMAGVGIENRKRGRRNARKVLLGYVYDRALRDEPVSVRGAEAFMEGRTKGAPVADVPVEKILRELAAEFDADPTVTDDEDVHYRFDEIRRQFAASAQARDTLRLERRSLGEVVYSTADSVSEESDRAMGLFDRALEGSTIDLNAYLPSLDRIDVEEEFELVAFDEELQRRGIAS